jgi:hypothetical protein
MLQKDIKGSYIVRVVSREVCGRHVCILRMLWVLSSFPRSERETRLLVDFAARLPHVFVPVLPSPRLSLPARLLLVDFGALPEATGVNLDHPINHLRLHNYDDTKPGSLNT